MQTCAHHLLASVRQAEQLHALERDALPLLVE